MTYEDVKRIRKNPTAEDCDNNRLASLINIAVEKQIARKPRNSRRFAGLVLGFCSNCNCGINSEMKYCDNCGQNIDWGD